MTLHRQNDGNISTTWYQKAIASGRYLHFQAHNPMTHKRNVVMALTDRAIALKNPRDRPKSINKVKELLKDTRNVLCQMSSKFYNNGKEKDNHKNRFIPAPYVPGLSERLKKSLNEYDLTLSCKTTNRIGNIYTRTKYTLPKDQK